MRMNFVKKTGSLLNLPITFFEKKCYNVSMKD